MIRRLFAPLPVSGVLLAAALVLSFTSSPYALKLLIMALIYIGLALSLNLIFGIAGLMNLGQAAFYGIGAYTAALLATRLHVPFLLCLPAGAIAAAIAGGLLSLPVIRLKGIYLSVTTLAFGEIVRLVCLNWISVTRGPMGITGIPLPSVFGFTLTDNAAQYRFLLVLTALSLYIMWRISHSPFGMMLRAIRENEEAAQTLGIYARSLKIKAFLLSSGTAGLFGAFFAFHAAYISPSNFSFNESITVLSMVVFGGMGGVPGVVAGALILSLAPDVLRFMEHYRMLLYGLLLFLMVVLRPQGLISEAFSLRWQDWGKRSGRRQPAAGASSAERGE